MSEALEGGQAGNDLFDRIQKRALEIVAFHGVTNGVTFTEDEMDAIEVGMSSGIHAAIEELIGGR